MIQLLEYRDHFCHEVLVHDQLAAVRLAVETYVVDLDAPQLVRFDWATGPPTCAEFGGGDRVNGRSVRGCLRRRRRARDHPG